MKRHVSTLHEHLWKRYFCVLGDCGFTRKHEVEEEIELEIQNEINEQQSAEQCQSDDSVDLSPRHYRGYCQSMHVWVPLTECMYCFSIIQYQGQEHRCPVVDSKQWKDANFIKTLLDDIVLIVTE